MDFAEIFSNPAVIWFLVGLTLILLELSAPGLIIAFFGVGAWITSLSCLIFSPSINMQLIIFIIVSLLSLLLLRKQLKNKFFGADNKQEDTLEDEYIGKTVQVIAPILKKKQGKVSFKGTVWSAVSDQDIDEGNTARIISKESIVLKVEKV